MEKWSNDICVLTVESSLGVLPDLEPGLLLAAGGVQQVPRHLVVDLQHAELHLQELSLYMACVHPMDCQTYSRRRNRQKRRQRSSLLFGGWNFFHSLPHYRFSTRIIKRKGWIEERTLGRMDASERWYFTWFTPHQSTTLQKWMFFQKLFSNHPCC